MDDLYSRIENLCKARGENITQMCKGANVPRGNLSDLKMGRQHGLSAKNMDKIARYLSVSVEYLLSGEPEHKNIPATREGSEDEVTQELYSIIKNATPEERQEIINFANYIKSKRK